MTLEAGTVQLTIEYGKDLPSRDLIARQDPYCSVKCGSQLLRTRTHKNGARNPVWNETLTFQVVNENDIELSIYDEDTFSRDDIIGTARLSLAKAREQGRDQVSCPVVGKRQKQRGFVAVRIQFEPNSKLRPQQAQAAAAAPPPQAVQYIGAPTMMPYPGSVAVPQSTYAAPPYGAPVYAGALYPAQAPVPPAVAYVPAPGWPQPQMAPVTSGLPLYR